MSSRLTPTGHGADAHAPATMGFAEFLYTPAAIG